MKKIRSWVAALLLVASFGGSFLTINMPMTAAAGCSEFLGIPAWYDGLTDDECEIKNPSDVSGGLNGFIWRIALNVVGMALVAVGYISIGFILYGGFILIKGMTGVSPGSSEIAANSRKMILNACIGLVLSLTAIAIASYIAQIYSGQALSGFGLPTFTADNVVQNILNMFYVIIGAVAVIIMIISGFMFTVAGSEPSTLTRAKNMIYYAVIGLAVDIFAFAITAFIIGRIG